MIFFEENSQGLNAVNHFARKVRRTEHYPKHVCTEHQSYQNANFNIIMQKFRKFQFWQQ